MLIAANPVCPIRLPTIIPSTITANAVVSDVSTADIRYLENIVFISSLVVIGCQSIMNLCLVPAGILLMSSTVSLISGTVTDLERFWYFMRNSAL